MSTSFLIAATSSGCGKTTLTMGLMRALSRRGLTVQPFKCGPDYIDTQWHRLASGQESVNLDTWMSSPKHVTSLFCHYGKDADVCVTEGVMGLFDGYDRQKGSSGEIARILQTPVILIVNAKSTAYSVAPVVYGFRHFDPSIRIAGVIFNQVASAHHYSFLRKACEDAGMTCFGYLPKSQDIELPSRHLGLTLEERFRADTLMNRLADLVEKHIDLELMMKACVLPAPLPDLIPTERNEEKRTCISVARDEAFNFTYRANIDALRTLGEVVFFSPIHDKGLPSFTRFLYLPGGYPEFFLPQLTANKSMMSSIKGYLDQGGKALAECGGMLYLSHSLTDMDGQLHQMADFLPIHATFQGMRLHLGYRSVETPWGLIHGHEFHYSDILDLQGGKDFHGQENIGTQHTAKGMLTDTRLFLKNGLIAGYTHLYWAENPTFIRKIINMS